MFKLAKRTNCVIHSVLQQRYFSSRIELKREYFQEKEQSLITDSDTEISLFKYESGVEAMRFKNNSTELIILPFQGHQIWDCKYKRVYKPSIQSTLSRSESSSPIDDYHSIAMQSMFDEPISVLNTDPWDYLRTYGAYFIHCGILAMGAPGDGDDHGLHGEIANGQFNKSFIDINEGNNAENTYSFNAEYIAKKQFDYNYKFISTHSVSSKGLINTTGCIENYYHKELPAMYMAHVNFRPECNAKLYFTATCNKHGDDVQIRTEIPAHIKASQEYIDLLDDLTKDPSKHYDLDEKMIELLSTEVVMTLNNYKEIKVDNDEWSVTLQKLKDDKSWKNDDGSYVLMHKSSQLPKGVRWMVVDPNIEAMGMVLPATGGPEGRSKAIERNEMISVPAAINGEPGKVQFDFRHGFVDKMESDKLIALVEDNNKKPL